MRPTFLTVQPGHPRPDVDEITTGLVIAGRAEDDLRALGEWFDLLADGCRDEADRIRYEAARAQELREEE